MKPRKKKGRFDMKVVSLIMLFGMCGALPGAAQDPLESDTVETSLGDLVITFVGHGSLMMKIGSMHIQIDPYGPLTDYSKFPAADLILITHHHGDHLDLEALQHVRGGSSVVVLTERCAERVEDGIVMKNGDKQVIKEVEIEAVPAYNIVNKRDNGEPYHPKGEGNGYILTFGDRRIYIAGDTENTPEMKALEHIDIAFLPMNLPYTMTPEMVADAVLGFKPSVLYPYHFGETDTSRIRELLKENPEIEVQIRKME